MTGSPVEAGVQIRPELASDREAVRRVAAAAFADEGPTIAALLDALDAAGRVVVGLVAELDGSVVGLHAAASPPWLVPVAGGVLFTLLVVTVLTSAVWYLGTQGLPAGSGY